MKFENGQLVRDVVTGFQGRITARMDHIAGSNKYRIEAQQLGAGAKDEPTWLEEERLVVVGDGDRIKL